ncbi:MAG: TetR/AcrR family transcriptional regulator [Anaerolineae bacterium]
MPRPDVSAERKAQILQAAQRVFVREGLANARMEQVAAEAGLSVGILYHYFRDRDDLIYHLLVSLAEQDLAVYPDILHAPGSPRAKLAHLFVNGLEGMVELAPLLYALYVRALTEPAMRGHLRTVYEQYLTVFAALVEQGIAQGELRPMDATVAAQILLAVYLGLLEMVTLCETPDPAARFAAAIDLLLASWSSENTDQPPVQEGESS